MSNSKHGASFEVIERDSAGRGITWLARCSCRTRWTGATYEEIEDKWRRHAYEVTGAAPKAMGDTVAERWAPG